LETGRYFPLLRRLDSCAVCGSQTLRPLHVEPAGSSLNLTAQVNRLIVGCEACGVVYSDPLPTQERLDAYYAAASGSQSDGWDARIAADEGELEAALRKKAERSASFVEALDRAAGLPKGHEGIPAALDFGCGLGAWLDPLQERGWRTYGIEPGPTAARFAGRRHTMLERPPTEPTFDLTIVHHVLEHLRDPVGELRRLAQCTHLAGLIWVSVPNLGGLGRHGRWRYVSSARHLFSYTLASLRSVLSLAGFEVAAHSDEPAWPSELTEGDAGDPQIIAIGRCVDTDLPLPERPLDAALDAMLAFDRSDLIYRKKDKRPVAAAEPARGRHSLRRRFRRG
jgi:SAM-dependent methyltransferase